MPTAVVIPYFQREAGILARALRSIAAQVPAGPLRVVVVDDASPVPADREVASVPFRDGVVVEILRKPNGGPAAARNHGLDALGDDVDRVAFLDSDDEWVDDHLARAGAALDAGHDFYFADHYQLGQSVSAFARAGRLATGAHEAIEGDASLRRYRGDMVAQVVTGNVIGTSTVVYDFGRLRAVRFDEAFVSAGEDYLFWIDCARAGARFAFSTAVEVRYGAGVNVYAGSGWGTDGHLERVHNEMRYRKRLLDLPLAAAERRFVVAEIATLRADFAGGLLNRLAHRRPIAWPLLRAQLKLDARTLLAFPTVVAHLIAERTRGDTIGG